MRAYAQQIYSVIFRRRMIRSTQIFCLIRFARAHSLGIGWQKCGNLFDVEAKRRLESSKQWICMSLRVRSRVRGGSRVKKKRRGGDQALFQFQVFCCLIKVVAWRWALVGRREDGLRSASFPFTSIKGVLYSPRFRRRFRSFRCRLRSSRWLRAWFAVAKCACAGSAGFVFPTSVGYYQNGTVKKTFTAVELPGVSSPLGSSSTSF